MPKNQETFVYLLGLFTYINLSESYWGEKPSPKMLWQQSIYRVHGIDYASGNMLVEDNEKLVKTFNAQPISSVKNLPDFYAFNNGLVYSHRNFEQFMKRLVDGEKSAIVSGLNASGTLHLGHKPVFDINLFFQKKYNVKVFIPISDDESYVTKKAATQGIALNHAMNLAKDMLAFGFDKSNTYIIIDQLYTNIYNLAIKLSRHITMSEIKAIYGYKNEDNLGMHFYPAVQTAHILLPEESFGIKNVLVPIGPDEDSHLRAARDIASRSGYDKPAVLHTLFMPGVDGQKMSKSKDNAIFYHDDDKTISKKIGSAFSGGKTSVEEHRKHGGDPDIDVACTYLQKYYLSKKDSEKLFADYRSGKILSGEVKQMLKERVISDVAAFNKNLSKVTSEDVEKVLLKNKG